MQREATLTYVKPICWIGDCACAFNCTLTNCGGVMNNLRKWQRRDRQIGEIRHPTEQQNSKWAYQHTELSQMQRELMWSRSAWLETALLPSMFTWARLTLRVVVSHCVSKFRRFCVCSWAAWKDELFFFFHYFLRAHWFIVVSYVISQGFMLMT
jgi:hypothetical protein